jgi:GNAT superfamily N-acetyltransferase
MEMRLSIALARERDLPDLPGIELAAARLLEGHAPDSILEESTPLDVLSAAQAAGRLWVALADDRPVGFAIVEMLEDGLPHLDELDVHPEFMRRGMGTALVRVICDWTAENGFPEITLTTFRAVSWNMPFYAKMGFEVVPEANQRPALRAVVDDETARGLDPETRCVMRYRVAPVRSRVKR